MRGCLVVLFALGAACGAAPRSAPRPEAQAQVLAEGEGLRILLSGDALLAAPRGCQSLSCAARLDTAVDPRHTGILLAPFLGDPGLTQVMVERSSTGDLGGGHSQTMAIVVRRDGTPACRLALGYRGCSCTSCVEETVDVLPLEGEPGAFVACARDGLGSPERCVRHHIPATGECAGATPTTCHLELVAGERVAGSGRVVGEERQVGPGLLLLTAGKESAFSDERGRFELPVGAGKHRVDGLLGAWQSSVEIELAPGEDVRLHARTVCADQPTSSR